jgi:hypothetical protein
VPSFGPAGQSLWLTKQNVQTRRYVKQTAEIPRQLQFPDNYFKQPLPPFNIHRGNWFYVSAILFVCIWDKGVFGTKCLLFPWTRTVMVSELILHFPRYHRNDAFLGALENSRRGTIRFMPVRPSVRLSAWNNSAPTARMFTKFDIWVFLEICRENSSFIKIWKE